MTTGAIIVTALLAAFLVVSSVFGLMGLFQLLDWVWNTDHDDG